MQRTAAGKRLALFLPVLIPMLQAKGAFEVTDAQAKLLMG
ncbi:hypothetical protein BJ994_003532 [Arthrobacter pigmenti]|uniref:Uncharacterized protein n=1 Tax=Arthrobacter pigmenti TaxID=271432 RepID=A0A846RZT3_9MICC|nr:hypothetical protein [Arthrobacter pigmenti]